MNQMDSTPRNRLHMQITVEVRRHNGNNPYGGWLRQGEYDETHGEIPDQAYDEASDEALEHGGDRGHIIASNGQHYDWRLA